MSHVDLMSTEAEFVEFTFADERTAVLAENFFPVDLVRTGEGVLEYRTSRPSIIEQARMDMAAIGIVWSEAESSLTEAEMWPEWTDDHSLEDECQAPTP